MTPTVHNASTYSNHGCRCAECTAAHAAYQLRRRAERRALLEAGDVNPQHGSESTYVNYDCRCADCRAAHAARKRNWLQRKVTS